MPTWRRRRPPPCPQAPSLHMCRAPTHPEQLPSLCGLDGRVGTGQGTGCSRWEGRGPRTEQAGWGSAQGLLAGGGPQGRGAWLPLADDSTPRRVQTPRPPRGAGRGTGTSMEGRGLELELRLGVLLICDVAHVESTARKNLESRAAMTEGSRHTAVSPRPRQVLPACRLRRGCLKGQTRAAPRPGAEPRAKPAPARSQRPPRPSLSHAARSPNPGASGRVSSSKPQLHLRGSQERGPQYSSFTEEDAGAGPGQLDRSGNHAVLGSRGRRMPPTWLLARVCPHRALRSEELTSSAQDIAWLCTQ